MQPQRPNSSHRTCHLPMPQALDDALRIGVPPAAITELVGPASVGKSQFCYTVTLQVSQWTRQVL